MYIHLINVLSIDRFCKPNTRLFDFELIQTTRFAIDLTQGISVFDLFDHDKLNWYHLPLPVESINTTTTR